MSADPRFPPGSLIKGAKPKRAKGRARPAEPLAALCVLDYPHGCTGRAEVRHHRLMRSGLGGDDRENTMDLCNRGHLFVHAERNLAREHGWIIAPSSQPTNRRIE